MPKMTYSPVRRQPAEEKQMNVSNSSFHYLDTTYIRIYFEAKHSKRTLNLSYQYFMMGFSVARPGSVIPICTVL